MVQGLKRVCPDSQGQKKRAYLKEMKILSIIFVNQAIYWILFVHTCKRGLAHTVRNTIRYDLAAVSILLVIHFKALL